MANIHKVNIGEVVINTSVLKSAAEIDESLNELLSIAQLGPLKRVVGLDIEKEFAPRGKYIDPIAIESITTLMLCCSTSCVIIKLSKLEPSAYCSISRFLQQEDLTFVGIRMNYCLQALEKYHGIKCRNAFELNSNQKSLNDYRLIDFAYKVTRIQSFLPKTEAEGIYKAAALSDGGADTLSQQQITAATLRAFLCFYVANYSCGGYVTIQDFWKHPYGYDPIKAAAQNYCSTSPPYHPESPKYNLY